MNAILINLQGQGQEEKVRPQQRGGGGGWGQGGRDIIYAIAHSDIQLWLKIT